MSEGDDFELTHPADRLVQRFIIKEGFEKSVSRRIRWAGWPPAIVSGVLATSVSRWFWVVFLLIVVANVYLVHRMYEMGWKIYEGSFGQWGREEEGSYHG